MAMRGAKALIVGLLIIIGALLLFMVLLLRHRVRAWNARLQHRGEGLRQIVRRYPDRPF